ncbi:hypothetical protein HPSA20_1227 [Helicobacter pylori SouthAfrica20]|uniref:Uncharacterized protein n=2 Tax=Helicobacter pylori TaxID=210 RepID=T2SC17_HELPX|nr:hypothetical protein HPSA20_1227 [Helicobacter pylori SouthAfrica20]EQD90167.1 hypothetical protein HPSA50_0572 [Helicobacter pylori SouthAfrica50]
MHFDSKKRFLIFLKCDNQRPTKNRAKNSIQQIASQKRSDKTLP